MRFSDRKVLSAIRASRRRLRGYFIAPVGKAGQSSSLLSVMRTAIVNRKSTYLLTIGIVIAGSIAILRSLQGQGEPRVSISGLIAASGANSRTIEARLSGESSWSPFHLPGTAKGERSHDKNLASAIAATVRDA